MANGGLSDSELDETLSLLDDTSDIESLFGAEGEGVGAVPASGTESGSAARQATKAIEAAQGSAIDAFESEAPAVYASSSREPTWQYEQTPLLDAGPAPPDYASATAWRRSQGISNGESSISDIESQPVEGSPYRPAAQEQSTLQIDDEALEEHFSSAKWKDATKRVRRNRLLISALILVMISLSLGIIMFQSEAYESRENSRNVEVDHPDTEGCSFYAFSDYQIFHFDEPSSFRYAHVIDKRYYLDDFNIELFGDLHIFPAPPEQEAKVAVWISVATSDAWEVAKWNVVEPADALVVWPPLLRRTHGHEKRQVHYERSCLHTWTGIFVQGDLENFQIYSGFANVFLGYSDLGQILKKNASQYISDSKSLTIENEAAIESIGGNIQVHYLEAPQTSLWTESGSITGTYALRNTLWVGSEAGPVDIIVEPKPPMQPDEKCSNLTIKAQFGQDSLVPEVHPEESMAYDSKVFLEIGPRADDLLDSLLLRFRDLSGGWYGRCHFPRI